MNECNDILFQQYDYIFISSVLHCNIFYLFYILCKILQEVLQIILIFLLLLIITYLDLVDVLLYIILLCHMRWSFSLHCFRNLSILVLLYKNIFYGIFIIYFIMWTLFLNFNRLLWNSLYGFYVNNIIQQVCQSQFWGDICNNKIYKN